MARTDIGRAVPLLKGEYSPTTTYELNDIVSLNGSLYWHYSHEETTNVAPQATSTWKVVLSLADAEAYIARAEFAAESAEDAAEIATAAKTAAESASTTATGASATATTAKNDAVTAKTAAETAQAGAVIAKTAAETARDAAQASATAAGTSATNAGNSAGTAEYYAGIATTAGETASEKATEATGAATTATSAAATATSAKDTAVSSASTASTAATTATSAATAAQAVKDSIPQDYTALSEDVDELKTQITDKIYPEIYYWKDLAPLADEDSNKTANYYLSGLGGAIYDNQSGVRLYTYPVTAGDYVKLVLSNDTAGTYQWQDSKIIDSGDGYTHQHVIGNPVTGAVDTTVIVPTGATYLIVSQFQTNTTNKVQVYDSRMDLVETDIGTIIIEASVTVTDHEKDKYINKTGGVSDYVGYTAYSTLIPVKKGDVIKARLYCNPSMTAIAYVTADYVFKHPAVIGKSYKVDDYTLTSEHTGWICLSYYMDYEHTCTITRNITNELAEYETLRDKFIVWCGDSIMRGNTWNDANDGWAGRVADMTGCRFVNYGIGGSTITNNVAGGSTPTIYTQIETAKTAYPDADYIIFDGGCNDADLIGNATGSTKPAAFGTFDENDFSGIYDTDTFCGAFETICMHLSQYWLGKHVGYIIPHKMGVSNNYHAGVNNYRTYYETAIQICNKWGIKVLNLWDECYLNPKHGWMCDTDNTMTTEEKYAAGFLYADRQHLTSAGYDYESTIVAEWVKGL